MDDIPADETARIYRALGELFLQPPTEEQVTTFAEWAEAWLAEAAGTLPPAIESPLEMMGATNASDIEELQTAFPKLFRGVSQRESPDPPYESLYRDGTLYGDSTTAVREAYRQAGLDVSEDGSEEPPDHLGIELQFLGELRAMEGDDDPRVVEYEQRFIDEHIGEWIDGFHAAVSKADPPGFYAAAMDLTRAMLEIEQERLERLEQD